MAEPVPNLTVIVERGCHPDEVEAIINSINTLLTLSLEVQRLANACLESLVSLVLLHPNSRQ